MLWDCLSDGNVKDIVEIDGLEKEERYRKILESQPDSSKLDRNYGGRLEKEKNCQNCGNSDPKCVKSLEQCWGKRNQLGTIFKTMILKNFSSIFLNYFHMNYS